MWRVCVCVCVRVRACVCLKFTPLYFPFAAEVDHEMEPWLSLDTTTDGLAFTYSDILRRAVDASLAVS